ncbi:hypothetical protein P154DRAFT_17483 [Amniculicola lignicola CBS 123094]|uniref:Uncharacterized protein n=1 Tax=Amniculicola lignicola CBS 123094 TaxID=1392246 RepID=A0A6A5X5Q5_9PLEO|nr:hypothetical protein P154DRAFT_17483 [Amniculicola lignicola CBS 123094]
MYEWCVLGGPAMSYTSFWDYLSFIYARSSPGAGGTLFDFHDSGDGAYWRQALKRFLLDSHIRGGTRLYWRQAGLDGKSLNIPRCLSTLSGGTCSYYYSWCFACDGCVSFGCEILDFHGVVYGASGEVGGGVVTIWELDLAMTSSNPTLKI